MVVLGFGQVEKDNEKELEDEIRNTTQDIFNKNNEQLFISNEVVDQLKLYLNKKSKESSRQFDEYRKAEKYPDRYYYITSSVTDNASHIVVILFFLHINRKYSMSSDGWASMQTKKLLHISFDDLRKGIDKSKVTV